MGLFLERNFKLLADNQPEIFNKMKSPEIRNAFPGIGVGFCKNQEGIIDNILMTIDNVNYIDSKTEAEKWAEDIDPAAHTVITVGFGMGYHIEAFIDRYPDKKIIVIEPDKQILFHALHLRDLDKVFSNCTIWVDEDLQQIRGKIFELITHPLSRGIQFKPYIMVYGKHMMDMLADIQKLISDWAVMINTKRTLVDKWYDNRIQNAKQPSVNAKSLLGKFRGMPAILVGAGPSLQTQIELIKSLENKAVVIAASTASEILHTNNIKPTFMIAIDQDPISSGGLFKGMTGDVPLIFDGQVAQNAFDYNGKKFQIQLNVNKYTNAIIPDLPIIESGPSVANVALDFLHKLGCSPILICGLDLSYTNDKLYCDGTQFNQDMSQIHGMKMLNNKGETCTTEPSFLSMRNWYSEYANRIKPPVFNCTERGLVIDNIPNADINTFKFENVYDLKKIIDESYFKDNGEPNYIDVNIGSKITTISILELEMMLSLVEQNNGIVPQVQQFKVYSLLDEFIQPFVYLAEIRCEESIRNGMPKEEAIQNFSQERTKICIDNIKKLIKLMTGNTN